MDIFRKFRFPSLDGFFKALTSNPENTLEQPEPQLQVLPSEQETEPESKTQDEQDESSSEASGEEDDDDDRRFKILRAIEDLAFKEVLLQHIDPEDELDPRDCDIITRCEGSYNHCVIIKCKSKGWFAIKVPARGTKDSWTDDDAFNMRSEVFTMKYIRRHTKIPVPKIHGWDNTLNNFIGAPYVLMSCVKGKPAWGLWVATNPDGSPDFENIDSPSLEHEQLRYRLLSNLATTMAELRNLQFDKMGMLHFDEDPDVEGANPPTVGHYFEDEGSDDLKERAAYQSTSEYFQAKLEQLRKGFESEGEIDEEMSGVLSFYRYLSEAFPLSTNRDGDAESFVLAHPDLDLQNIFVDDMGNITGIIDWQGVRVVPRPLGYAALPLFLRKNWGSDYSIDERDNLPWSLEDYRELYARYMKEELSPYSNDGNLTLKSGLYCAAAEAIEWRGGSGEAFIQRIFKEIRCLRAVDEEQFLVRLGSDEGWASAETMLEREFEELFSP